MADARVVVGLVRGVHGLHGAVRVEVLTDNEDRFSAGSIVRVEGSERPLTVLSAHRDGPGLLVRFREIPDRPAADSLREKYLEADAANLPADHFYWHEVVGCTVSTETGEELGKVSDVFRVGESEVYVVNGLRGEILVPAVATVVRSLDPAAKRIVVDAEALGLNAPGEAQP